MTVAPATVDWAKFWNSRATDFWATLHQEIDRLMAPVTAAALRAADAKPGERAIDIGCGSGSTVMELARRVGPTGRVVGADISENSVAHARERIAAAALDQAEVLLADVATHRFVPASFDLAFSRFGVMFFADAVAAFANLHGAMARGGRLSFAVFRTVEENPWTEAPVRAVQHMLPPIPVGPAGTGMWSWADPARVHAILEGAGFRDVALQAQDPAMVLAGPGQAAEAAGFAMHIGQASRALLGADDATRARVRAAFEEFFARHDSAEGITLPGAIWVVTARV